MITVFLVIVLPFMAAWSTHRFFVREMVDYVQPEVKFTNEMIVEALTNPGTANAVDVVKQFSTIQDLNDQFPTLLTSPKLSVDSFDENSDLRNENLKIEFKFDHLSDEKIKSLHILFYLQYYIGGDINAQFKTLCYVELNAPTGGSIGGTIMKGPLELKQKSPIATGTIKRSLYATTLEDDYLNYGIQGLLDLYNARNQTTVFDAAPLVHPYGLNTETKIELNLQIPTSQRVLYYASGFQVFKNAWVQYFTLLVPIYYLLYVLIYGYIVKSNILE